MRPKLGILRGVLLKFRLLCTRLFLCAGDPEVPLVRPALSSSSVALLALRFSHRIRTPSPGLPVARCVVQAGPVCRVGECVWSSRVWCGVSIISVSGTVPIHRQPGLAGAAAGLAGAAAGLAGAGAGHSGAELLPSREGGRGVSLERRPPRKRSAADPAQASPDHGFCGVRARAGDPCLELR